MNEHRYGTRTCPHCGRCIALQRNGLYRRHFAVELDGRRHLCAASGTRPAGVLRLLAVEPTPEERRSHAQRLLHRLDR